MNAGALVGAMSKLCWAGNGRPTVEMSQAWFATGMGVTKAGAASMRETNDNKESIVLRGLKKEQRKVGD
jgi:hypothetical protein